MPRTEPEPFSPHWQQCLGHARCEGCGSFVDRSWRWFAEPLTWTRCYCEPCVERLTKEDK